MTAGADVQIYITHHTHLIVTVLQIPEVHRQMKKNVYVVIAMILYENHWYHE